MLRLLTTQAVLECPKSGGGLRASTAAAGSRCHFGSPHCAKVTPKAVIASKAKQSSSFHEIASSLRSSQWRCDQFACQFAAVLEKDPWKWMAENDYAKLSTLGKVENIAGENKLRLKNGWWATLTSRAKNCHCERSEAIASFTLRLLRYARNDMSLIRKIRYQLAWDTTEKRQTRDLGHSGKRNPARCSLFQLGRFRRCLRRGPLKTRKGART